MLAIRYRRVLGDGAYRVYLAYSGKMVSQRHYQRLQSLLKETNGEIVIGGKTKDEGSYIEPTVVVNVKMDDALLRDELFGPILPIVEVKDINEAIKIVRADEKPLASYCFGKFVNLKSVIVNY